MSVILRNGNQVDRNKFVNFDVAEPTVSYSPISNYEIVETVEETLDKLNYKVTDVKFLSNSKGSKFVAQWVILSDDTDYNMMIAIKNSYDKSMSAGVACGSNVVVCSNGAVSGEIAFSRRHRGQASKIVLEGLVEGIKALDNSHRLIVEDLEQLKNISLNSKQMAELAGRLFIEEEVIRLEQLSIIKQEIKKESFDYGIYNSGYNFYNAVTHALKNTHPMDYLPAYIKTHNLFVNENFIQG